MVEMAPVTEASILCDRLNRHVGGKEAMRGDGQARPQAEAAETEAHGMPEERAEAGATQGAGCRRLRQTHPTPGVGVDEVQRRHDAGHRARASA